MTIHCGRLAALALLVAWGCGDDQEQASDLAEILERAEVAPAVPASTDNRVRDLEGSGVEGSVRLTRGEGGVDVELAVEGVSPDGKYLARIYRGECGREGVEAAPVGHLTVTGTEALAAERIDPALLDPEEPHSLRVLTADQTPVACADLDLAALDLAPLPAGVRTGQPAVVPTEEAGEGAGQAASEGINRTPGGAMRQPPPDQWD
jgi:hypothetical protein